MSTTRPPAYDQASGSVEASRRGAHRARAKPALAGLPILAGLLVVAIAAGGAWYVLDSTAKDSTASVQGAVGEDDDGSSGAVPASAGASGGASASATTQPEATATPSADPTDNGGAGGGTDANVDRSLGVKVLNSLAVKGLAARVAGDLTAAGWTITGTDNSKNKNLVTTKVYYGKAADKTAAEAVVKDLGYGIVDLEPSVVSNGLIVVAGQDAQ